jgi:hypothetical protein
VRLIAKSTLPLMPLGNAPGHLGLYAARQDGKIQIVARRKFKTPSNHPPSTVRDFRAQSVTRQPLMVALPNGDHDATQCSFARVALQATKGSAEMASMETTVLFHDHEEKKAEKAKADDATKEAGDAPDNEEPELPNLPLMRVRPLRVTISSTWTSHDTEPVLSVSLGWAGREREI